MVWQTPNIWISEQWICYVQVGQRDELLGLARKAWYLMTLAFQYHDKKTQPQNRDIRYNINLSWDQNSQALFQALDFSWECNLTSQ